MVAFVCFLRIYYRNARLKKQNPSKKSGKTALRGEI
jgi:hypothetical protein